MNEIIKDLKTTYEINKSTFITYLKKVNSVDEAKIYIQEIKNKHKDATHHISCYIIGNNAEIAHTTDDKEPAGTAGLPTLEVFRKNNVTNFVCITVRYFGGIKLGAGGLIRAYSSAASLALKESGLKEIIDEVIIKLVFNYNYLKLIQKIIDQYPIMEKDYSTNIMLKIKLPKNDLIELKKELIKTTANQILITEENDESLI